MSLRVSSIRKAIKSNYPTVVVTEYSLVNAMRISCKACDEVDALDTDIFVDDRDFAERLEKALSKHATCEFKTSVPQSVSDRIAQGLPPISSDQIAKWGMARAIDLKQTEQPSPRRAIRLGRK